MQTLQLGVFFGKGGMGAVSFSLLILLYIIIWLFILIYTILLYILFFKIIIFSPKFNFLASYSSLFLKSNLSIFPYFGLKAKSGTQNRIPTSILVWIISWYIYIYIYIYIHYTYIYIYIIYIYIKVFIKALTWLTLNC